MIDKKVSKYLSGEIFNDINRIIDILQAEDKREQRKVNSLIETLTKRAPDQAKAVNKARGFGWFIDGYNATDELVLLSSRGGKTMKINNIGKRL